MARRTADIMWKNIMSLSNNRRKRVNAGKMQGKVKE